MYFTVMFLKGPQFNDKVLNRAGLVERCFVQIGRSECNKWLVSLNL